MCLLAAFMLIICCRRSFDVSPQILPRVLRTRPWHPVSHSVDCKPYMGRYCSHSPVICVCTAGKLSDYDRRGFSMAIAIWTAIAHVAHIDIQSSAVIIAQNQRASQKTVKRVTSQQTPYSWKSCFMTPTYS